MDAEVTVEVLIWTELWSTEAVVILVILVVIFGY